MGEFAKFATKEATIEEDLSDIGYLESFGKSAEQMFTSGFADEMQGVVGAGLDVLEGEVGLSDIAEAYRYRRDESREEYRKAAKANPKMSLAGGVTGGIASLAIPGLGALKGVGGAAKLGGLYGLGSSEADLTKGEIGGAVWDTAKGAALGMAGQKVLGGVASGLKGVARRVAANKYTQKAYNKAAAALKPTTKAIENYEKMGKEYKFFPRIGKEMVDESIPGYAAKPSVMLETTNNSIKRVGNEIDEIYTAIDLKGPDGMIPKQWLIGRIESVAEKLLDPKAVKYYNLNEKMIRNELSKYTERLIRLDPEKGQWARVATKFVWKLRQETDNMISKFDPDAKGKQAVLQALRREFKDILTEKAAKFGLGKKLGELNYKYSNLATIKEMLRTPDLKQQLGGFWMLKDWMAGTTSAMFAGAIGGVTAGSAVFAGTMIGQSLIRAYGKQLSSKGNLAMGKHMRLLANNFDKFSPTTQKLIDEAGTKGVRSLLAVVYILQQSDPKFQEIMSRGKNE